MPLPPAATVEEPSVLLPKENPVDMAAGSARRRQAKGSARRSRLKAQAGPAASLPPSRDLARTASLAAAKTGMSAIEAAPPTSELVSRTQLRKRAAAQGLLGRGGASAPRESPWDGRGQGPEVPLGQCFGFSSVLRLCSVASFVYGC